MSDYSEDGFDMSDKKPVRDTNHRPKTEGADSKNVRFKLGGGIQQFDKPEGLGSKAKFEDLPASLKKQSAQDEREDRKQYLTLDDIQTDSKSNKHIIYKFMKKGFTALSAEELACTMVNPTFSVDFKNNAHEDWNANYQAKVVEKL